LIRETTLPSQYEQLESTGRLANFRRAAGTEPGPYDGLIFNDSDAYKWIEACAYSLATGGDSGLETKLNSVIETVLAAQMADGYLNTYFQLLHPDKRWKNLGRMHEMYCAGHLIEAGVAVFENLGDRRLLDGAIKFADHVMSVFGPGKRAGYPGHPEIELALIRLAGATGQNKYREFAKWLIDGRGQRPSPFQTETLDADGMPDTRPVSPEEYSGEYAQDHAPIREHNEIVGHAVRAAYLYAGAAEFALDDGALMDALERVWANVTQRRMYVTGGIGSTASNEGFTADFDLPNLHSYAETCAAIGLIFWGQKMLEATGNSEYADAIERSLYNGALSGISLDGLSYFYANPLESRGSHERSPWFECACCPPNIARLIANLGQFGVAEADDAFYIHQFFGFEAQTLIKGEAVTIRCESQFPWSGNLRLSIDAKRPVEFALLVRIPVWSDDVSFELSDSDEEAEYDNGYAVIRRSWKPGDAMTIDLGIEARWVEADPRVRDNLGRNALIRGPLVYCSESVDLDWAPQLFMADTEEVLDEQHDHDLMGIVALTAQGVREVEEPSDDLYLPARTSEIRACEARFIPYFAWGNRGPVSMQVWVRGA
jgi:DUF1680 family protein